MNSHGVAVGMMIGGVLLSEGIINAADKDAQNGPQEKALPAKAEMDFRASFYHLIVPTGAMTADKEELLLRYQVCDLAHEIAFLRAISLLDLSGEQAGKLLPSARKARDLAENRGKYLKDCCTAYFTQCEIQRDNNIMVVTGCNRKQIEKIIGEQWGICGPPNYGLGRLDHSVREEFYRTMAALGVEAETALSQTQKAKLAEVEANLKWIDLPAHTRREIWSFVTDKATDVPLGAMGQLFLVPGAITWLEKKAGLDASASIKRAEDFQSFGAEVAQLRRTGWSYAYRLVDGANIFAGMNFTEKQLAALIDTIEGPIRNIHAAHSAANKRELFPLVALMTEIRDDTAAGKAFSDEKLGRVIQYQKKICRGNYGCMHSSDGSLQFRGIFCPLHKEYTDGMEAVFKKLEDGSIIDTAQCKLLYDTSQCDWLPPKNYRDPVRVGQAAKRIVYAEHEVLAHLKSLSEAEYAVQRDKFAREITGRIVNEKASEEARKREIQRATAVLDKVHGMTDVAYEMEKYSLLSELLKRHCPEMTGGAGTVYDNNGDIRELTWDTRFKQAPYNWSSWDFMKAMEKADKPLPRYSEKPVPSESGSFITMQEWPAHFLMDPDFVPALKTLLVIARNPRKTGANLDNLSKRDISIDDYNGE